MLCEKYEYINFSIISAINSGNLDGLAGRCYMSFETKSPPQRAAISETWWLGLNKKNVKFRKPTDLL